MTMTVGDLNKLLKSGDRYRTREGLISHIDPTKLSDEVLDLLDDYPHLQLPERVAVEEEIERRRAAGHDSR